MTSHSVHVTQPYTGITAGISAKVLPRGGTHGKFGLAAKVLIFCDLKCSSQFDQHYMVGILQYPVAQTYWL